jgi:hypothetical protein
MVIKEVKDRVVQVAIHQDQVDLKVQVEHKDHQGLQVMLQGIQVIKEIRVIKEVKGQVVHLDQMVIKVQVVHLDQMVIKEVKVQVAHPDQMVIKEVKVQVAHQVLQVINLVINLVM